MNETQIPSDILGTQEVIINELPTENDDLITDHIGAVEDTPEHIEQIEQQDINLQEFEELKKEEQQMELES